MFTIINSLPWFVKIIVMAVCETVLVVALIKKKTGKDKYVTGFLIILTIVLPFLIIDVLVSAYPGIVPDNVSNSNLYAFFSSNGTYILCFMFLVGLFAAMIGKIRSGNISDEQKRLFICCMIILAICVPILAVMILRDKYI